MQTKLRAHKVPYVVGKNVDWIRQSYLEHIQGCAKCDRNLWFRPCNVLASDAVLLPFLRSYFSVPCSKTKSNQFLRVQCGCRSNHSEFRRWVCNSWSWARLAWVNTEHKIWYCWIRCIVIGSYQWQQYTVVSRLRREHMPPVSGADESERWHFRQFMTLC